MLKFLLEFYVGRQFYFLTGKNCKHIDKNRWTVIDPPVLKAEIDDSENNKIYLMNVENFKTKKKKQLEIVLPLDLMVSYDRFVFI